MAVKPTRLWRVAYLWRYTEHLSEKNKFPEEDIPFQL